VIALEIESAPVAFPTHTIDVAVARHRSGFGAVILTASRSCATKSQFETVVFWASMAQLETVT
jgi:hypothetical protein